MSKPEARIQELLRELQEKVEQVRAVMRERSEALPTELRAVVHMETTADETAGATPGRDEEN